MNRCITLMAALLFVGCTHSLHLAHVSDFAPYGAMNSGTLIQAEAEQSVVLGFAFDTNYVDEAVEQLEQQCRKGHVVGVTTQYSTSHGFFSWTNRIRLTGRCFS